MPTYSYACTACEHRFDIYQEFSADALTTCPECQGRLRKVFGSVGVSFKGSGFYLNDHGKASNTKADAKSEAKSPASDSGKNSSASGSGAGKSNSGAAQPSKSASAQSS